jgi:hypothetical protein
MQRAIHEGHAEAELAPLEIFDTGLSTSVQRVLEALTAAAELSVDIVHCSFGLARPDSQLDAAVERLLRDGVLVVASHPARGTDAGWPSSHPRVISVQGDARCGPADWSILQVEPLLFGACAASDDTEIGGASLAAARFTGHLSRLIASGNSMEKVQKLLWNGARWRGRERRS